jgi:hypothetical protein
MNVENCGSQRFLASSWLASSTFALVLVLTGFPVATGLAQGTAFTYQGQLNNNTNPATGNYDFTFTLYAASSGGSALAGPITNAAVVVSNGLFAVLVDFGPGVFTGGSDWLGVGVRSNGVGAFSILLPRQQLTPAPYAIYAEGANAAGLSGTIPTGDLSGTYGSPITLTNLGNIFAGNGGGLTSVNAATVAGLSAANFWQVGGNTGVPTGSNFVGTTDNQYLDLRANGVRALRLRLLTDGLGIYSNAPDVIGGSSVNLVAPNVVGAAIAGGGGNGTNGTSYFNEVYADFGAIGGGAANSTIGRNATVSGGFANVAGGAGSFVGGGGFDGTTLSGNVIRDNAAAIGGGLGNSILSGGTYAFIGGGTGNTNNGFMATIGGGQLNVASGLAATVAGGSVNQANSSYATVAGGSGNIAVYEAAVGGGSANTATGFVSTVSGGFANAASGYYSAVAGGNGNIAGGNASFAAGQYAQTTHANTFIWGDGSQDPFTGANYDEGFNVLASGGVFLFNGAEGVHVDYLNQNPGGTVTYGLRFGAGGSGEGITSQRTPGANQYGLDLFTASTERMTIANNGFVGINTTSPSERLEVNGNYVLIDGGNAADKNGPIDAYIGGSGSGSDVQIGSFNSAITAVGFWNNASGAWMHIACSSISISGGSDLAEPFPVGAEGGEIPAGTVMVIDGKNPGQLKVSDQPYDRRVAGVISGANGINPGIQMRQEGLSEGGRNVALTGRVYVQAVSANGAIEPGDLLTTSSLPGYAMKVTDYTRAQGAILGKAMTALNEGKGTVLVLVTLQ